MNPVSTFQLQEPVRAPALRNSAGLGRTAGAPSPSPLLSSSQDAARVGDGGAEATGDTERLQHAREVHAAFTEFFGHTFFSQMIKAMRTTQRPPAYFHGGQAEEIFRSQLDQRLADEMSKASASKLAEPMFERQFPLSRAYSARRNNKTSPSKLRLRRWNPSNG